MNKGNKQIYQFKISLLEITPQIWRRIQVPADYTFSNFHLAIQKAMGWENYHLYQFSPINSGDMIPENDLISDIFCLDEANPLYKTSKVYYEYDFGDSWLHEVLLEKILEAKPGVKYPICVEGKRACPPEDCGGTPGYINLLNVIKSPRHNDFRHMTEWLGDEFYPEKFNPKDVCFDDE
jgi:hypothetical protein